MSADTIVELARMYSQDTPSTIYAGYHLYDNCEEMGMTWACLAALRAISASAAPLSGIWGRASRRSTWPASPSRRDSRPSRRAAVASSAEVLETGKLKGEDFPVRLLYNIGANPVGSYAAQRKTIEEILPKIPCIVTNDMESPKPASTATLCCPAPLLRVRLDSGQLAHSLPVHGEQGGRPHR